MAASKIQPNMGIWHLIAGIVIAVLGVYVWFNPAATLLGLALYLGIILSSAPAILCCLFPTVPAGT